MIRLFVVFSFLLLSVVTANAATWNVFNSAYNDYRMYFFDANSVEKKGDSVTLWVKCINNGQPDNDGSYSTATKFSISCANKTIQALNSSIYDKDRKCIKASPIPGEVRKVESGKIDAAIQQAVCTPDFPKDTSKNEYFVVTGNDIYAHAAKFYTNAKVKNTDIAPQ